MTRFLLACAAAILGATATWADIILPDQPRIGDFPPGPRGSLAFPTTMVARGTDGTTHVLQGYIFGQRNGDAVYVFRNPKTGLECKGTTRRVEDRSGKGEMQCVAQGRSLGVVPFDIPAGTYGRMRGTATGKIHDDRGRPIGAIIARWATFGFPDPAPLIAAFR